MKNNENLLHMIKFTLFSISAGIIQIISFTILHEVFIVIYWLAYLISLIFSILWNFTLNRKYTFKSAANIPKAMFKVACFYLVFVPLSTWWGHVLEGIGWNEYIILGSTMIVNFITEFIFTKYYVYHHQINTALNIKSS